MAAPRSSRICAQSSEGEDEASVRAYSEASCALELCSRGDPFFKKSSTRLPNTSPPIRGTMRTNSDKRIGRWDIDWTEDKQPSRDRIGDHAAARYRYFRRFVESLDRDGMNHTLFGLLLSAESIRDEIQAYEEEQSLLIRLTQTGFFVHQVKRLHAVMDAAAFMFIVNEPRELSEWEHELSNERYHRTDYYADMLSCASTQSGDLLSREIGDLNNPVELLTLLKGAIDKRELDELTKQEVDTMKQAFELITDRSDVIVMTLPTWFALPFEFTSTFGLSRWGNDRYSPDYSDEERFIKEASTWAGLNHPHVAKFLGACHVGEQPFIIHEKVRALAEYASGVKGDRIRIWRRVHELALLLQYTCERGFPCPLVDADQICCAQYEDRTVVLGVHLCSGPSNDSISETEKATFGSSLQVKFGVPEATNLLISILNIFRSIEVVGDDIEALLTEIPATCPSWIKDSEWSLISALQDHSMLEKGGIRFFVDMMRDFVGADADPLLEGYIQTLQQQMENSQTPLNIDDLRPRLFGENVSERLLKCTSAEKEMTMGPSCHRISSRFEDIYQRLRQQPSDSLSFLTAVATLYSLMGIFLSYSKHNASSCSASNASSTSRRTSASTSFSQSRAHQREPTQLYALHAKIDRFMIENSLLMNSKCHHWIDEWNRLYGNASSHKIGQPNNSLGTSQLPSAWYIPKEEVSFESSDRFGSGSFGFIFKGKWFDTPVVVKKVRDEKAIRELRQEADVWFRLNHINVVKMYGACDVDDLFFVCELASGGDLDEYLKTRGRDPYISWYCLFNAALGLQYLHEHGFVHADLKANNVLVGADGVAKLTDFGLTAEVSRKNSTSSGGALGAYRWKAPECLSGAGPTFASDVYSFAMLIIEILSGAYPWGELPDSAVKAQVTKGELPPRPSSMQDAEWHLVEQMCRFNPSDRITIDAVVVHLSSIVQKLDQEQLWSGGLAQPKSFMNLVLSRGGALMSLIGMVKGGSKILASYALNQITSVALSRNGRSGTDEINAILDMLFNGSDAEKALAAPAIAALAEFNASTLISTKVITQLVAFYRDGNDDQSTHAVDALSNISNDIDIGAAVVAAGGVQVLVQILNEGSDEQKSSAAGVVASISTNVEICDEIMSLDGVQALMQLIRSGDKEQKRRAIGALSNIADQVDIGAVLLVDDLKLLVRLLGDVDDEHKLLAAYVISNLAISSDISNAFLAANGIEALVDMLRSGTGEQILRAAGAISNFAIQSDIVGAVVSADGVCPLLKLLNCGDDEQKASAISAFAALAGQSDLADTVVSSGAAASLVHLINSRDEEQQRLAAYSIYKVATGKEVVDELLAANVVRSLVRLMKAGSDEHQTWAIKALANISSHADITDALVQARGAEELAKLAREGDDEQKELAANVLACVLMNGGDIPLSLDDIQPVVEILSAHAALLKASSPDSDGDSSQAERCDSESLDDGIPRLDQESFNSLQQPQVAPSAREDSSRPSDEQQVVAGSSKPGRCLAFLRRILARLTPPARTRPRS